MPYSIESLQGSDVVLVRASGAVTASETDDLRFALAQACQMRASSRVVLDIAAVDYIPSAAQARALAQAIASLARRSKCLVAIVAKPGAQYGVARMISAMSEVDDVSAAAYPSVDEAIAWVRDLEDPP